MKRRKEIKFISIILSFVCSVTSFTYVNASEPAENGNGRTYSATYNVSEYKNGEILIKMKDSCSEKMLNAIIKNANITLEKRMKTYVVAKAGKTDKLETAVSYLKRNAYVEWVQPNFEYNQTGSMYDGTYSISGITFSQNQWALKNDGTLQFVDEYVNKKPTIQAVNGIDVNVAPLWEQVKTKQGKKVVVAVIDTGIDLEHPSFKGKLWKNTKEIPKDGIDNDNNGYVDDYDGWNAYSLDSELIDEVGHGTHCVGIIAANGYNNVWGVTGDSNIKIMPVKVFSKSKNGNTSHCKATSFSILWGLEYAASNGAKICSISLGMEEVDNALREYMRSSKMLFVCAAGNDGLNMEKWEVYPAFFNFKNIIPVANIRWDGKLHSSSNYSTGKVGVAAPGSEIYSTLPDGEFGFMTGTSMATPYVAGIAALLYSYEERMDAPSAKRQINYTATKLDALTKKVSGGLVNAYHAYYKDVSAPSIQYKTTIYKSKGYADIKLSIADYGVAGIKHVRWLKGSYETGKFKKGNVGNPISSTGKIIVKKAQIYTIYAIDKAGNEIVRKIRIKIPVPSQIVLRRTSINLKKGSSYTLKPAVRPRGVYVKYSFETSDKKVVVVDSKGKIVAKRKGNAKITIKTQNGKRKFVYVTVK